jgi:hypothetical protein
MTNIDPDEAAYAATMAENEYIMNDLYPEPLPGTMSYERDDVDPEIDCMCDACMKAREKH